MSSDLALLFLRPPAKSEKHPLSKPFDLNLANVKVLQVLPGRGPVTAQRIIDRREKSGRFHGVEDLLSIRGFSQKKLTAMHPFITVSALPPPAAPTQKKTPPARKASPQVRRRPTGCFFRDLK